MTDTETKLAEALREFPENPNPYTYRRAYAKAQDALAAHDAARAQPIRPPDGGDVELSEQVLRMRVEVDVLRKRIAEAVVVRASRMSDGVVRLRNDAVPNAYHGKRVALVVVDGGEG